MCDETNKQRTEDDAKCENIGDITTLNTLKNDTDTNRGIWYINNSKHIEKRYSADTNSLHDNVLLKTLNYANVYIVFCDIW